jgi:hypothetical protein
MTEEHVPLFLIPHILMRAIRKHNEEVEWLTARRTKQHYYSVRIRTKPVNREVQSGRARMRAGKRRKTA